MLSVKLVWFAILKNSAIVINLRFSLFFYPVAYQLQSNTCTLMPKCSELNRTQQMMPNCHYGTIDWFPMRATPQPYAMDSECL